MMNDNSVTNDDAIVIERVFDAPVELIWQMWTDAAHFKQWYGPMGMGIPTAELDVRVGGKRLICMEMPEHDMKMWFTGEFREIVPNERLVYTDGMSDEHGNVIDPAAMGMDQPMTTEVTVVLEAVDGGTKMTMTHAGVPADSPGASGWAQAFDKLAQHIAA